MGAGKGGNEAKMARQDEQARQGRIRAGTKRINTIFDGGKTGTGKLAAGATYDPNATYYLADCTAWKPNLDKYQTKDNGGVPFGDPAHPGSLFGKPGAPAAPLSQAELQARAFADAQKSGLFTGFENAPGNFNKDFFAKRRESYLNYATPQVEQQRNDAQKELTFSLARAGTLNSSSRADLQGELQRRYDLTRQEVADKALSYETQARTSVEDARAGLISTLNATGDAEGAANSALSRSAALSQPAAYSPLVGLFTDFTAGLGAQAAAERARQYGGPQASPGAGLFGTSRNAVVTK